MSKNVSETKYWVPLLEFSKKKNKIVWSGKTLGLPVKNYEIKKMSLNEGLGLTTSPFFKNKKGLFIEHQISKKHYLLGVENIIKTKPGIQKRNKKEYSEENIQIQLKTNINKKLTSDLFKPTKSGLQISLSGRLGGANKASRLSVSTGSFRPQSFDSKLDYSGSQPVYTKWGIIGLKVNLS